MEKEEGKKKDIFLPHVKGKEVCDLKNPTKVQIVSACGKEMELSL